MGIMTSSVHPAFVFLGRHRVLGRNKLHAPLQRVQPGGCAKNGRFFHYKQSILRGTPRNHGNLHIYIIYRYIDWHDWQWYMYIYIYMDNIMIYNMYIYIYCNDWHYAPMLTWRLSGLLCAGRKTLPIAFGCVLNFQWSHWGQPRWCFF